MSKASGMTLRLNFPQWQGGNDPCYHFGSELLQWLAPVHSGPVETVPVPEPQSDEPLEIVRGVVARTEVLKQAKAARRAIDKHKPDRIVTLGGDCLVDLAPMAYLNMRYKGNLGILWVDAHPDVMTPNEYPHAHAHVLGCLLGIGDPEFVREVEKPIAPSRVMYAGLDAWSPYEGTVIDRLKLRHVGSSGLAESSAPVTGWIAAQGIAHLAVHFDLDVLDPAHFRPLLFNKPTLSADDFAGVPRGRMRLEQVVRLLRDVSDVCELVGLAIAEHMPWDMRAMRNMLSQLPLLSK